MDATQLTQPATVTQDAAPAAGLPAEPVTATVTRATLVQVVLVVLGLTGFFYFARPVILPLFLACIGAMTLKPLIRWSTACRLPPTLSAAIVLGLLAVACGIGFFELGRPALKWMNEAPQHMTDVRQRVQKLFPRL